MVFVHGMAQLPHVMPFGILVVLDFFLVATSAGLILISALSSITGNENFKGLAKPSAYLALATVIAGPIALLADLGHPLRFINLFLHFNVRSAMSWGSYILLVYTIVVLIYAWLLNKNKGKLKILAVSSALLGISLATYTGMLLAEAHSRFLWNSALTPVLFIVSGWVSAWGLIAICSHWFARATDLQEFNSKQTIRSFLLYLILGEAILVIAQLLVLLANGAQGLNLLGILMGPYQLSFFWGQIVVGMVVPFLLLIVTKKQSYTPVVGLLSLLGVFFLRYNIVFAGQKVPLTGNVFAYSEQGGSSDIIFLLVILVVIGLGILIPRVFKTIFS